jgi:hypothetical protein
MSLMLIGAAVYLAGLLSGRLLALLPARRRAPKPAKPVCGCEHDLSRHEPDGDGGGTICHAQVKGKRTKWDSVGYPIGWEMVQCSCRQYTGPRIMDPGYVARELSR